MSEDTEHARHTILMSMTKPKEGCSYCSRGWLCYHRYIQMPEHICFCTDKENCYGGSFHSICKNQTYEEHKNKYK